MMCTCQAFSIYFSCQKVAKSTTKNKKRHGAVVDMKTISFG